MNDGPKQNLKFYMFCIHCCSDCFYRAPRLPNKEVDGYLFCAHKRRLFVLSILFILECYLNISVNHNDQRSPSISTMYYYCTTIKFNNSIGNTTINYYKYPLDDTTEVLMDYESKYNSSYYWFMSMLHRFKNIGEDESPSYAEDTIVCEMNESSLGPIQVNKTEPRLDQIEKLNPDVKLGGFYAPAHCRPKHRVAVIVPYRDRRVNLAIFLRHIHSILKKQLLEYRIFVIEQYGTEKFNKGVLYNIAFLETQRFGDWHCLIFHDVDLIPEDERISYSCAEQPVHMAPAVEAFGYTHIFGGVTALTPEQYRTVNGYSNFYWNWGAEDDDFYFRIQSKNYTILRYNSSIARYATLPHQSNKFGNERLLLLMLSKLRFQREGLKTTKYNLIKVTKEKLYTHILADVNPTKMKLNTKSVMQNVINLHGDAIMYGQKELRLINPSIS